MKGFLFFCLTVGALIYAVVQGVIPFFPWWGYVIAIPLLGLVAFFIAIANDSKKMWDKRQSESFLDDHKLR